MPDGKAVVRDFIYLDVDKLYSLYSQLFEGVVEKIVESSRSEIARRSEAKANPPEGDLLDTEVAEVSSHSANKVLYDYMYQRLEERIAPSLISGASVNRTNFRELLEKSFLITATGSAEIEDYQRMDTLMSRFNDLGEAIAYAQIINSGLASDESMKAKKADIAKISDRNARKKAESDLRSLSSEALAKELAGNSGLAQDPKLLANLRLFNSLFRANAYEITIVPSRETGQVAFRGVLDKRWLRVAPEHLTALYGGFVEKNWTIVGQVAHVPGEVLPNREKVSPKAQNGVPSATPSMREPFRAMFRAALAFERMFLESNDCVEIMVSPIAIYRAMELAVGK